MPATVTYLSIPPKYAIPVRVFIHRKQVLAENQISVNEKSILTLSATALIRLSNFDLNTLTQDISPDLGELLLLTPLQELFAKKSLSKSSVLVTEIARTWKCKLVVSLGYLVDLRYGLGSFATGDLSFLDLHGIAILPPDSGRSCLLERKFTFLFLESEADSVDEKKQVNNSLLRRQILNNKLTDPLTLYVLSRPRPS